MVLNNVFVANVNFLTYAWFRTQNLWLILNNAGKPLFEENMPNRPHSLSCAATRFASVLAQTSNGSSQSQQVRALWSLFFPQVTKFFSAYLSVWLYIFCLSCLVLFYIHILVLPDSLCCCLSRSGLFSPTFICDFETDIFLSAFYNLVQMIWQFLPKIGLKSL